MKYLLTSVLAILGIFFLAIGMATPTALTVVTTSQSQPQLSILNAYPSSGNQNLPTILSNNNIDHVYITFTTGYFTTSKINSVSYPGGKFSYENVNNLGSLNQNIITEIPTITTSIIKETVSGTTYYGVDINLSYNFTNPNPGSNIEYVVGWTVWAYIYYYSGGNLEEATVSSASPQYFCLFSTPVTIYPGYFVMQYKYPNNGTVQDWVLSSSTSININLPSNIALPIKVEFIYVEYNASGNSKLGWVGIEIEINNNEVIKVPYNTYNTTIYKYQNAIYAIVSLNRGTYTINGYAEYVFGQSSGPQSGLVEIMSIAMPLNSATSSFNLTTQSYFDIGIGAVFLLGAVFVGRRGL